MSLVLVDTCGWVEWLAEAPLASRFEPYLLDTANLLVPTLVQFELYKWVSRERDEATALNVIGITENGQVLPLDTATALLAAELAAEHKLATADAIVYATARKAGAQLATADKHFANLPDVLYFEKP